MAVSASVDTGAAGAALGVLVCFSEMAAGGDSGFDLWHQHQQRHAPPAARDYRSARRYRMMGGEAAFMVVYSGRSPDLPVLDPSPDPSAGDGDGRTEGVHHTVQWACRETWSAGQGIGGAVIVVHCKPMQGRERAARDFIKGNFGPGNVPAMVRTSLWEVASERDTERPLQPVAGPHWVLLLESYDVARMALALHERLLHCDSDRTGLLVGSWRRYQLISADDRCTA